MVHTCNTQFARVENIRKFRMLTKELDHEDGELTATQKVKRAGVAQRFADLIADMYDETTEYPGGDLQHVHTAVAR